MLDFSAPQGWQCPICKRVYSPTTPQCFYCGNVDCIGTESGKPYDLNKWTTTCSNDWLEKTPTFSPTTNNDSEFSDKIKYVIPTKNVS